MPTTDPNGLVLYTSPDELTPLETAFNTLTASISGALDANVRTFKVANAAARDALATQRTPSKENPLQVWRKDTNIFEINYGSGWLSSSPEPNIMYINGSPYQRSGTWGGPFNLTGWAQHGSSGVWRGSINELQLPFTIPSGYTISSYILNTTGFTFAQTNAAPVGSNRVSLRVMQVSNGSTSTLNSIGWQLVSA